MEYQLDLAALENVPDSLVRLPQWVCWRADKTPVCPSTGRPAKADRPETWGTLAEAVNRCVHDGLAGVGFQFARDADIVGIDLDHVRDAVTGAIDPMAARILDQFDSYSEVSPSGTGIHVYARAEQIGAGKKRELTGGRAVEMYSWGRYFTVTGQRISEAADLRACTDQVRSLYSWACNGRKPKNGAAGGGKDLDAAELGAGCRHPAMIRLAGRCRKIGMTAVEVLAVLRSANAARCKPPIEDHDLERMADYVAAKPAPVDPEEARNTAEEAATAACQAIRAMGKGAADIGALTVEVEKAIRVAETVGRALAIAIIWPRIRAAAKAVGLLAEYKQIRKGLSTNPSEPAEQAACRAPDGRLIVQITARDPLMLHRVILSEMLARNDATHPRLFLRAGLLSRLELHRTKAGETESFRPISAEAARYEAHAAVMPVAIRVGGDGEPVETPARIPIDEVAWIRHVDSGFPAVTGLAHVPFFRPDGSLCHLSGLDRATGIYLSPGGLAYDQAPKMAPEAALEVLRDVLVDVVFREPADLTHYISAMLVPFVRPMITGPVPLVLVESGQPRVGKTLLCKIILSIVGVPSGGRLQFCEDDAELGKRVTSALMRGGPILFLDNLPEGHAIDSAVLERLLTEDTWQDRILGQSADVVLPVDQLFLATANNVAWKNTAMVERVVKVRIQSPVENPAERGGFRHDPLLWYVASARRDIVSALLALVGAWVNAGRRPFLARRLGGYESWSAVVGGIVEHCGLPDFLARDPHRDPDVELWRLICERWRVIHGGEWVRPQAILSAATANADLADLLDEAGIAELGESEQATHSEVVRFAALLRARTGRVYGTMRVEAERRRGKACYRLACANQSLQ